MSDYVLSRNYPHYVETVSSITTFLMKQNSLQDLTSEDLIYIPKLFLIHQAPHAIDIIWDRLPSHLRADPELQQYCECTYHQQERILLTKLTDSSKVIKLNCFICHPVQ